MSRRALPFLLAALGACWDFRGAIEARCADGGLTGCPDGGGGGPAGSGGAGGGTAGGSLPRDAGPFSCGDSRCVWDGGTTGLCFNGWCWENPLPQGNHLLAVWGSSPNDVWATGRTGTLLRWNGQAWTSYQGEVPLDHDWYGVHGNATGEVWLVGLAAGMGAARPPWRFDGSAWAADVWRSGPPPALTGIAGDDAGMLVAVGLTGVVGVHQADGGWIGTQHLLGGADTHATAVTFDAPGSCWLALEGAVAGVARCNDGAFDLRLLPSEVLVGLTATGPGELWAVGNQASTGFVVARTDAGTWRIAWDGGTGFEGVTAAGREVLACREDQVVNATTVADEVVIDAKLEAIWSMPSRSDAWGVGYRGDMVRSTAPGAWSFYGAGPRYDLFELWVSPTLVMAPSQNGAVVHRDADGWGLTFVGGTGFGINDIWFAPDESLGVMVNEDGVLESTTALNFSSSYNVVSSGEPGIYTAVWGTGPDDVWAVADDGLVSHRTAAGWDAGFDAGGPLSHIDGVSATRAFMVGDNGLALRRVSDGGWAPARLTPPRKLNAVWVPGEGSSAEAIAAGDGVYRFADGGWQNLAAPAPPSSLSSVWGFAEDDFYVVGALGKVLHYDRGTWRTIEVGTRVDLLTVRGRRTGAVKELWLGGRTGTVLHAEVP